MGNGDSCAQNCHWEGLPVCSHMMSHYGKLSFATQQLIDCQMNQRLWKIDESLFHVKNSSQKGIAKHLFNLVVGDSKLGKYCGMNYGKPTAELRSLWPVV